MPVNPEVSGDVGGVVGNWLDRSGGGPKEAPVGVDTRGAKRGRLIFKLLQIVGNPGAHERVGGRVRAPPRHGISNFLIGGLRQTDAQFSLFGQPVWQGVRVDIVITGA